MDSITTFFAMGGYAGYVWPAYGIAIVVLAALVASSLRDLRAREVELRVLEAESPRRPRRREGASPPADGEPGKEQGSGDA